MPFTTRMYARAEDRDRIALFLSEASAADGSGPNPGYWHPGDLIWGMYQNTVFDPKLSLRLWEDAATGALLGVTWLETGAVSGEMETQLAPAIRATDEGAAILGQALAWGRRVAARRQVVTLWARARDSDPWQLARLAAHGFTRDDNHPGYIHFRRPFDDAPLPEAPLPEGFSVRAVGGPDEWQRRVDLHRVIYHPSRVTLQAYHRLRAAPLYRPDLDLVAVAPNGDFVSYCILWYDELTRVGEYEPVGAHPDWRRRGVTRATLVEGLRRLRALGAGRAIVLTNSDNTPAIRLYESVGFVPHDHERFYRAS
ncbi:MAG TPA: GNAT family N-acetyltransferase [Ktedonobacterales bacterium]|jgi:GNAT superfamily N-acetyltransferase|nr:GNAT family N-acetyltransferase [Ktedonobacterales bacterium]